MKAAHELEDTGDIHSVKAPKDGKYWWYVVPPGVDQDAALALAAHKELLNGPFESEEELRLAVSGFLGHNCKLITHDE